MKKTKSKRPRNATYTHTAYTDRDRAQKLTGEAAILAEYRRLKLPPVVCGGLLLSPALVEVLKEDEPEEQPELANGPTADSGDAS